MQYDTGTIASMACLCAASPACSICITCCLLAAPIAAAVSPVITASHALPTFVAIDFETADYGRVSACALVIKLARCTRCGLPTRHFLNKQPNSRKTTIFQIHVGTTLGKDFHSTQDPSKTGIPMPARYRNVGS